MTFVFAEFEFDLERAELRRNGRPVRVEPQVFDLLGLLISQRARMVSKDEIFDTIWSNKIVSDAILSSRIKDARKAIGDDGKRQKFIVTIPRRGFRFVGDAVEKSRRPAAAKVAFSCPVVAVNAFTAQSDDTDFQSIAQGISNALGSALAAWHLFAVARQGASAENDSSTDVRYLVEGLLRRVGNELQIEVSLTDRAQGRLLWSDRIRSDKENTFELEEDIAAMIASVLMPELETAEAKRAMEAAPEDRSAWQLGCLSLWTVTQCAPSAFPQAQRDATRAIEVAPQWSMPHAILAQCAFQQAMATFESGHDKEVFAPTLSAAQRAVEIDPGSWMGHAFVGVGEMWANRNHQKALVHLERALELNPSAAMTHQLAGCIAGFAGYPRRAIGYQERLLRIDPTNRHRAVIEADLGLWYMLEGDLEQSAHHIDRALGWNPKYGRAWHRKIALCGLSGQSHQAREAARVLKSLGQTLDSEIFRATYPFRRSEHKGLVLDGLRAAGLRI